MRVVTIGIIGLLLGIGVFQLDTSGYFERWEKLAGPSVETLDLFSTEIVPDQFGNPRKCDYSSPEFSFISNAPKTIAKCVQHIVMDADANSRTVYAIDNTGELWTWSYFDYAYYYYAKRIIFPTAGFTFGLLIGLFELLTKWQVANR